MPNNAEYWRKRFKQLEEATHRKDASFITKLERVFVEAADNLDFALYKFFSRFSDMEHVSLTEANRILNSEELKAFKMSVDEYIKLGEKQNIEYSPEINKLLEEASLKFRVTRLEAISYEMAAIIGKLTGNEHSLMYEEFANRYRDRYYQTAFTVFKNYGVGVTFAKINEDTLDNILKIPWTADGTNFSTRIWNNQVKLINTLTNVLSDACIRGSGYAETSERFAKQMHTNMTNAARVVTTESAFFSSQAQKDCFNELGAEEYEIIATLDNVTDEECGELDGKVFKMDDFKAGSTAPPFHPNCRCTTAPYFDDSDIPGYVEGTRTARNGNDKTYRVPRNMTYKEWEKKYGENSNYTTESSSKSEENSSLVLESPNNQSTIYSKKESSLIDIERIDISGNPKLKPYEGLEIIDYDKKLPTILPKGNIITKKQFGKKIRTHAYDYDLSPSSLKDRNIIMTIINDIIENCEEIKYGSYRSQEGICQFYRKGNDVVVTSENGQFVTLLSGGKNATRFKNARTTKGD